MGGLVDVRQSTTAALWDEVESAVRSAGNLEEAASTLLNAIYEKFESSLALARVFVTVPYKNLPQPAKYWVSALADDRGVA